MHRILFKVLVKTTGTFVILLSQDSLKLTTQKQSSKQLLPKVILKK